MHLILGIIIEADMTLTNPEMSMSSIPAKQTSLVPSINNIVKINANSIRTVSKHRRDQKNHANVPKRLHLVAAMFQMKS